MRIHFRYLIALFWAATSMAASTHPTSAAAQMNPDEPIDISLRSASLVETLRSFAEISGSELELDPTVQGSVTIEIKSIGWRQVLDRICKEHDLNCEILSGEPSVLRIRPTRSARGAAAQPGLAEAIDMSLRSADLRETLQTFGLIIKKEVIVDAAVTGSLTIEIRSAPWPVVLEESCNLSGCRIEWGEDEIHILPTDPAERAARRAPLSFAEVPIDEALATLARLPIFGVLGEPELTLGEGLGGTLSLELSDASWLEALNAVCRAAACEWQLTYGAPSRLEVKAKDPGLEQRVEVPSEATTVGKAAALLARARDLDLEMLPGVDPNAEMRFAATEATWKEAVCDLCKQADCGWSIADGQVTLRPLVKMLSSRPRAGAEDQRLAIRFFPPEASTPVEGTARFNWTAPIRTLASTGEDRWLARLAWIPFGPELHAVMPLIVHCRGEAAEVQLLDAVRVPLEETWSQQWRGAILELSSKISDGGEPVMATRHSPACSKGPVGEIHAAFRGVGKAASSAELDLTASTGTYLLITPPGPERRPVAALLALGTDDQDQQEVALVKPNADGSTIAIDRWSLPTGGEVTETLVTADGRQFELVLRFVEP